MNQSDAALAIKPLQTQMFTLLGYQGAWQPWMMEADDNRYSGKSIRNLHKLYGGWFVFGKNMSLLANGGHTHVESA